MSFLKLRQQTQLCLSHASFYQMIFISLFNAREFSRFEAGLHFNLTIVIFSADVIDLSKFCLFINFTLKTWLRN